MRAIKVRGIRLPDYQEGVIIVLDDDLLPAINGESYRTKRGKAKRIICWSNLAIRFLSIASEILRFFPISKNLSRKHYRFNQPIFVSRTRLVTSFNDLIVVSFEKKKKEKKKERNERTNSKKGKDTSRL